MSGGRRRGGGRRKWEQREERPAWIQNKPAPWGECEKKGYSSKQAANLALRTVRALRRHQAAEGTLLAGGGERAVYRCPKCRLWHLTSQGKRRNGSRARPARGEG